MEPVAFWFENLEAAAKGPDGPIQLRLKGCMRKSVHSAGAHRFVNSLTQNGPWPFEATIDALGARSSVRGI